MTPTLFENGTFKATFDRLGLAWMPNANWSEVGGPNVPLAWGTSANPYALARSVANYLRSLADGVPWIIDMGGWSILRAFMPQRGAIVADICRALDSGVFPCADEISRQAPFFKALRSFGIKPDQVAFYFDDGDEFSLYQGAWLDFPDPFKGVRDVYLGGKTLPPGELDRRFHQAMVNTHKVMQAAHGFDPDRLAVAGCCAIDTAQQGPAIDTPISHVWAGDWPGATPAMWDGAWATHQQTVNQLTKLGKRSMVHLSATMPTAQAARGAALGATYNAVFCGGDAAHIDAVLPAIATAVSATSIRPATE